MAEPAEQHEVDAAAALEATTDQTIEACGGDARAAVRTLLVVNDALDRELEAVYARSSHGYLRGRRVQAAGNSS